MKNKMRPIHPGEILREEYLVPLALSANALAQTLGVPANRISGIIAGKRSVTADTALRLARAFKTSPELWLNLRAEVRGAVGRRTAPLRPTPRVGPFFSSSRQSARRRWPRSSGHVRYPRSYRRP